MFQVHQLYIYYYYFAPIFMSYVKNSLRRNFKFSFNLHFWLFDWLLGVTLVLLQ